MAELAQRPADDRRGGLEDLASRVRVALGRSTGLVVLMVGCVVVFSTASPYFATLSNGFTLARLAAEVGLVAIGMSLVIASGGIDLSVGAIFGLSSVTVGYLYAHGVPIVASVVGAVLVGLVCGLFNGAVVVVLRIHPLLVTLGTLALFRGIALGISDGSGISGFPASFELLGQAYVGLVPVQCLVWAGAVLVAVLLATRTTFGRYLLAMGVNDQTARFSGMPVARMRLAVYGLSGLLAGLAAVIYTSRVLSSRADAGNGMELLAIAAVVVGGASIQGGEVSVGRTTLAVLAITMIPNGFVLSGFSSSWQFVAIGAVMILVVVFNEGFSTRMRRIRPSTPTPGSRQGTTGGDT